MNPLLMNMERGDQVSSSSHAGAGARDLRLEQLEQWLAQLFGTRDFQVTTASADASFRRYFRVTRGEHSWIAMDAPPAKEDMEPYIRIAAMLVDVGVNAPRVLHRNHEEGFLLNSDLGSQTYLMELDRQGDADRLYADAIQALVRIQSRGAAHAAQLPPYDDALLRREMGLFPEWFCGRHLGISLAGNDGAALAGVFDILTEAALQQPRVFVHRDYHSRNLMVGDGARHGENPGILDFQDAVCGPVTYDLVSLLRDCYIAWPVERVRAWALQFRASAAQAGVEVGASESEFLRGFDLMGVQRHLKAIGIFARLWHRDGKPGYLNDIPRTLNYVRTVSQRYQELQFLHSFIEARVLPALEAIRSRD
ncbi:MAG TPA: phosphotransferase [Steroidobacteraceae bacterium]|nr:phosphotransferase [Steroidobacteraceae bacterium]